MNKYESSTSSQYETGKNLNSRIRFHESHSTNPYGWYSWIFDQCRFQPHSRVLEIGCGLGTLWLTNIHRIPNYIDITLSDLSYGMLQDAQKSLEKKSNHFSFVNIDARRIPFRDGDFDIIIANHMLYLLQDRIESIKEIRRVLKQDGYFYASTTGSSHLRELQELIEEFDPSIPVAANSSHKMFGTENGEKQLSAYFSECSLTYYEDSLVVTKAEPLIDYVLSTEFRLYIEKVQLERFTDFIEQKLARKGEIYITKEMGIFVAR